MRLLRTNFDRQEMRRDRRYALPNLTVVLDGRKHVSDNWSLGGFLLKGDLKLAIGAAISGTLHVDGSDGLPFTAELIWREAEDDQSGSYGFHFKELTPATVDKLDRALARRLVPRKRP